MGGDAFLSSQFVPLFRSDLECQVEDSSAPDSDSQSKESHPPTSSVLLVSQTYKGLDDFPFGKDPI